MLMMTARKDSMSEQEFRKEMRKIMRDAAKMNDADKTLVAGFTHGVAAAETIFKYKESKNDLPESGNVNQ